MEDTELREKIARMDEHIKSNSHRIDDLEEETKNNRDLIISVKEIATEVKYLRENQEDMNNRLKKIEEKPCKNWDKIISSIIGTIVGAITGGIIGMIIK